MASVNLTKVLDQINAAREACGASRLLDFPKGPIGSRIGCPIAKGVNFNGRVGKYRVDFSSREIAQKVANAWGVTLPEYSVSVPLPTELRKFVEYFDAGNAPEFVG